MLNLKELGTLKTLLGWGLINSRIRFLKSLLEGEQRIFESNLFHFMMVDGKKSVFKEGAIGFNGGKFLELQVEYEVNGFGIRWQR